MENEAFLYDPEKDPMVSKTVEYVESLPEPEPEKWPYKEVYEHLPMGANIKNDTYVGMDEIGRKTYRMMNGVSYSLPTQEIWDNIPRNTFDPELAKKRWESFKEAPVKKTWDVVKKLPKAMYDSVDKAMKGTATPEEFMGLVPAVGAASIPFKAPDGALRMFGGANAKDPPKAIYELNEGTPRQIWEEKGVFVGPDSRRRFEIDTSQAKFTPLSSNHDTKRVLKEWDGDPDGPPLGADKGAYLSEILDFPDLYKQYPDLAALPVLLTKQIDYDGAYLPSHDAIVLNPSKIASHKGSTQATLLHEIQHAIQGREGFEGKGSSIVHAQQHPEFANGVRQLNASKIKELQDLYDQPFSKEGRMGKIREIVDKYDRMVNDLLFGVYQRNLGESEARGVELRRNYTPEERRKMFPIDSYHQSAQGQWPEMLGSGEFFLDHKGKYHNGGEVMNMKDPVSGNPVPPGSFPQEVRDDLNVRVSQGEYILPANVVRHIGLEKIASMHKKAEEDMLKVPSPNRGYAEGGYVGWDPMSWLVPGGSYFQPTPTPQGEDTTSGGESTQEYRVYVNDKGEQISILFIDGKAQADIPDGYFAQDEVDRVFGFNDEENDETSNDFGLGADDGYIDPDENWYNMTTEQLLAEAKRGSGMSNIFGFLPGLAGGLLGTISKVSRVSKLNNMHAFAVENNISALKEYTETALKEMGEVKAGKGLFGMALGSTMTGTHTLDKHKEYYNQYEPEQQYGEYTLPTPEKEEQVLDYLKVSGIDETARVA